MRRSFPSFPPSSAFGGFCCLLLLAALLGGCGLFHKDVEHPDFTDGMPGLEGTPVPYAIRIVVNEPDPGYDDGRTPTEASLKGDMEKHSQLVQLSSQPPDSVLGLERRARVDQETAVTLLHSLGYYEGTAEFHLDESSQPVTVTLILTPGRRYLVGDILIRYRPEPVVPPAFRGRTREVGFIFKRRELLPDPVFPRSLQDVRTGDPAAAAPMLDAVAALPLKLRTEGYPLARVASAVYTLDCAKRVLNADITVDPGPAALMDGIAVSGTGKVHPSYLERLIPWKEGQPWNADLVSKYREILQQLGLFNTVDVKPAGLRAALPLTVAEDERGRPLPVVAAPSQSLTPQPSPSANEPAEAEPVSEHPLTPPPGDADAAAPAFPPERQPVTLPVDVTVRDAAFRTVGAGMRYSTDLGLGVQGSWEHRNLFGNGEKLTVKAPIAQNLQGLSADFVKPAFGRAEQKFLAGASVEKEKTDAYTKTAAAAYTGLERRLAPHWWGEARLYAENGSLKENAGKNRYRFLSFSLALRRDTRNNALNPTSGSRVVLTLAPHSGFYDGNFNVFASKLDAAAYYAPSGTDNLVLAGRVALGSMMGSPSRDIPASLRYYAGGGGSVRGYAYQALGPRDAANDPLGGRSFQEVNLEARFKVTDHIGIVPFVDGGMVYESEFPRWGRGLDWAVGLGLRYFTPIGPVRFDVAFPLTPLRGDKRFQMYISIGQAF